ncbi:hypothetical protein [uncultured Staphylococcus sp.]|uniref:hypothetical protein n=1 Tax=uncultured Staphylococcus sp. TaxID=189668 RepID=UPI002600A1B8|nr:hypothetical protein [uncultured Staphylococcus sp.]
MSPLEWRDWIIGGQDKVLDLKEKNLHAAIAYGMVEGGKRLTGMFKEIELQRHQIRGTEDEYYEEKRREKEQRLRERQAFLRGAKKFIKGGS